MPRPPRNFKPGGTYLIIQRGNNGNPVFRDNDDRQFIMTLIGKYSVRYNVAVTQSFLLENSIYITAIPASPDGIPKLMHAVIGGYSRWFNKKYSRRGHLWVNRYIAAEQQLPEVKGLHQLHSGLRKAKVGAPSPLAARYNSPASVMQPGASRDTPAAQGGHLATGT